ncbi:3-hydroxy-3-methylglutaryl-coenzyme A reductase [Myxococcus fulvus]|nr:hydroxymethylglutaryl-CoA reductase [Myxococcus fulvus]SEU25785.1 3-hydroxy-3-methylglutaryl-coenzyme A reductase [Myxococcus fulvus]
MSNEGTGLDGAAPRMLGPRLRNRRGAVEVALTNHVADLQLIRVGAVRVNGGEVPLEDIVLVPEEGAVWPGTHLSSQCPFPFERQQRVCLRVGIPPLEVGEHRVELELECGVHGVIRADVTQVIDEPHPEADGRIPRALDDDFAEEVVHARQAHAEQWSGTRLNHVTRHSFEPSHARSACEHFTGVAQVPLGLAGPLIIQGEHAHGPYLIPLATTEGAMVASYNRGIKLLNACGGARCTVLEDAMQRAPVFVFDDAKAGREFSRWLRANEAAIAEQAEATSHVAKLLRLETYQLHRFVFVRFNFATGDAAGQNMVGKATFAALLWIREQYPHIRASFLDGNVSTDKKSSRLNILQTRGKRVTAEVVVPKELLLSKMRTSVQQVILLQRVSAEGSSLAGAHNNGCQSANALAALFIATGQDVAALAESAAGDLYMDETPEGDLRASITLPSLVLATHGGGTGLPTQRECLELMDCFGRGKVRRLAEIVAGVVLAGELSLACAVASALGSEEWVTSHESLGRHH